MVYVIAVSYLVVVGVVLVAGAAVYGLGMAIKRKNGKVLDLPEVSPDSLEEFDRVEAPADFKKFAKELDEVLGIDEKRVTVLEGLDETLAKGRKSKGKRTDSFRWPAHWSKGERNAYLYALDTIKAKIQYLDLTAPGVSEQIGANPDYVTHVLNGTVFPSPTRAKALLKALSIRGQLFDGIPLKGSGRPKKKGGNL